VEPSEDIERRIVTVEIERALGAVAPTA